MRTRYTWISVIAAMWPLTAGAIPAFPGAQGFGAKATGGRGGSVQIVTTLDASGPGSLQAALDAEGPRIVVFAVSGVITADVITIPHGQVTIAGETAPGGGITIDGRLVAEYEFGVDDIIVRHVRVRPTTPTGAGDQFDSIQMSRSAAVILDHVSVSWGIDETVDLYEARDVTVQWSTIEQARTEGHPEGVHNYGLINGPDGANASIHHDLFAHNQNRNPALATGPSEVRNNVVYDVRHGFIHHNPAQGHFSIVGNWYRDGAEDDLFPFVFDDENGGAAADLQYYLADNYVDDPGVLEGVVDNPWTEPFVHPSFEYLGLDESYRVDQDFDFAAFDPDHVAIEMDASDVVFDRVLGCAGAWPRDVVALQSVQDAIDRTGGWGASVPADLMEGLVPERPPADGDADGMPDAWEREHGLDPADGTDHATVMPSEYTAIETYLHERADAIVPARCAVGEGGGSDDGGSDGPADDTAGGDDAADDGTAGGGGDDGTAGGGGNDSTVGGGTAGDGTAGADGGAEGGSGTDGGCSCRSGAPTRTLAFASLVLVAMARRRR